MTFSQRMKLEPVRSVMQIGSLDKETRNALWNLISPFLRNAQARKEMTVNTDIWTGLYHNTLDTVPNMGSKNEHYIQDNELFYQFFRGKVCDDTWNQCLDFVEFIAAEDNREKWSIQCYNYGLNQADVYVPSAKDYNSIFEQYLVGYRFVYGEITPITAPCEIRAIEDVVAATNTSVRELMTKAVAHLSDRRQPDYAKSVHCSISAVEAQCCILLENEKITLGQALKQLENKGVVLHPALKDAFAKLYGYTSDANGVRHGSINPSDVDQGLAKFMLVACSAFINYVISKKVDGSNQSRRQAHEHHR